MKSLEILKNNENARKFVEPNYLNNAIKELEELQNKTCENCKYNYYDKEYAILMCTNEDNNQEYLHNSKMQITLDFCCNKWESIDEK